MAGHPSLVPVQFCCWCSGVGAAAKRGGSKLPGFKSQHRHLLFMWPWARDLSSKYQESSIHHWVVSIITMLMMPRLLSGHILGYDQNQPGGPPVSGTLRMDQYPPLPHLKETNTASSKCSTLPPRDGPVLPDTECTETGILSPGSFKAMDTFLFYMRKLQKNNTILQSQESLVVWRCNPPKFSQEWFLPHFWRVSVNLDLLRSVSWGSKWTEEKMVHYL